MKILYLNLVLVLFLFIKRALSENMEISFIVNLEDKTFHTKMKSFESYLENILSKHSPSRFAARYVTPGENKIFEQSDLIDIENICTESLILRNCLRIKFLDDKFFLSIEKKGLYEIKYDVMLDFTNKELFINNEKQLENIKESDEPFCTSILDLEFCYLTTMQNKIANFNLYLNTNIQRFFSWLELDQYKTLSIFSTVNDVRKKEIFSFKNGDYVCDKNDLFCYEYEYKNSRIHLSLIVKDLKCEKNKNVEDALCSFSIFFNSKVDFKLDPKNLIFDLEVTNHNIKLFNYSLNIKDFFDCLDSIGYRFCLDQPQESSNHVLTLNISPYSVLKQKQKDEL